MISRTREGSSEKTSVHKNETSLSRPLTLVHSVPSQPARSAFRSNVWCVGHQRCNTFGRHFQPEALSRKVRDFGDPCGMQPCRQDRGRVPGRLVVTASHPDLKPDRGSFKPSNAIHVFELPRDGKRLHRSTTSRLSTSSRFRATGRSCSLRACWTTRRGSNRLRTERRLTSRSNMNGEVTAAELSPVGKTALTASYNGSLRLWNLETKKEQARPIEVSDFRSRRWVERLAVHWDARRFATADQGGLVRLWTLPDAGTIGSPFEHKQPLASVEFSPAGKLLLTASTDGVVCLWAADDGTAIGPPLLETGLCHAAKLSDDGRLILVSTPLRHLRPAITGPMIAASCCPCAAIHRRDFSASGLDQSEVPSMLQVAISLTSQLNAPARNRRGGMLPGRPSIGR